MTKKEQKRIAGDLLKKSSLTRDDKIWLYRLFQNHPSWQQKKGVGVADIIKMQTKYGDYCFGILRKDGTKTDISFHVSISGAPTKRALVIQACRPAIEPIMIHAHQKVNFGVDKCPITNELLIKGQTHIDHYDLTFAELFKEYVKKHGLNTLFAAINQPKDNELGRYFVDQRVKEDFITFHNANTHLRAVTKEANLRILKQK